mgnify:CR=1 FL=1
MKLAIGSDHAGFNLKRVLMEYLDEHGIPYTDFGTYSTQRTDYPEFGIKVAKAVAKGEYERGILCCGNGIGMSIVANKIKAIRASLCHDTFSARQSRSHNDANILCLGARVIGPGLAQDILEIWLSTGFAGGRYGERLEMVRQLEEEVTK